MHLLLPPGPKGLPIVGHLFDFPKDPLGFLAGLARDHGDISTFTIGRQRCYFLNHPDLVKEMLVAQSAKLRKGRAIQRSKRLLGEGLLTLEGAAHKRSRMMLQPAFHRERVAGYADAMVACAAATSARWHDGAAVDMAAEMHRLTMAIVGRTLFSADVEGDAEAVGHALNAALAVFNITTFSLPDWTDALPLPRNQRFNRARAVIDEMIFRMIRERRASGRDHGDLLSMLLTAQDEEGLGLTDDQVRDEAITLFLAGLETTSNAMAWTWHQLAQQPEAEAALHEELDRVLGDRLPTFADLPALAYTRMLLSESMRLYPPVWLQGRRIAEPFQAGPYALEPGALVFISQWTMNRDPRYYADPERFDPLRWTPDAVATRPKFAYFPFGGGPRLCIGEQFAWMELTLLLALLARRWRARPAPGPEVVLQPVITLRPKHGIPMRLEAR
jgi:cytochrome P450